MHKERRQLTLFINEGQSEAIEKIRREFNPEQYKLIKSHVTLCREDELEPFEKIIQTLENLLHPVITIDFGAIERFAEGKGLLLPATDENKTFQQLRELILADGTKNIRKNEPHITLMHPRNSTCTDTLFQQIEKIKLPGSITFSKISLIEQCENAVWKILKEYTLTA